MGCRLRVPASKRCVLNCTLFWFVGHQVDVMFMGFCCVYHWRWWLQQLRLLHLRPGANHKTKVGDFDVIVGVCQTKLWLCVSFVLLEIRDYFYELLIHPFISNVVLWAWRDYVNLIVCCSGLSRVRLQRLWRWWPPLRHRPGPTPLTLAPRLSTWTAPSPPQLHQDNLNPLR